MGQTGLTWITSKHGGHLAVGDAANARNIPLEDHAWVEALHCATNHEESHKGPDAAWLYAAPGSGVSLNVGRTMHVSEYELEKAGISPATQSYGLSMFSVDEETNLTQHLGLG